MDQQPATVQFLDSTEHVFHVSKKAEGGELFDKVCAFIGLVEKDYFGLSFADGDGNQQWLYDDKRISKQLKGRSWNFYFKVKFYPPEPATLAEDQTRYLLCLQVRYDIFTGKLPATLATHALLGSYVVQSVQGDYEPSVQYMDFLRGCNLAPLPTETLYEKVEELHKHHKGQTSAEADLYYLENAKKLSMYGVQLFHAKDAKDTPVQIGVSAHGINVYLDQIRVHRFIWQNIIKIGYRRNAFIIEVKPGELEKNESTIVLKLPDYEAAKRVWRCGVEHHTFFRLIQPEEKPYRGLFRWGSARFRYQGRTQFQAKMASQMFCKNQPIQRSQSVHVTENDGKVAVTASLNRTLPLMYSENGADKKLEWNSHQMILPEEVSSTHVTEAAQNKGNIIVPDVLEVGKTSDTSGKLLDNVYSSAIFTTSVATTTAAGIVTTIATTKTTVTNTVFTTTASNLAATTTADTTATGHYFDNSLHVSPHPIKIVQTAATTPSIHEISNDGFYGQSRYVLDNSYENKPDISIMKEKEKNAEFLPVEDKAVVYHPGHYEKEITASPNRQLREPPVEPDADFVLIHRPKAGSTGKIFHQNGEETNILVKEEDIEAYPIHHFANIYHSGFSHLKKKNKDLKVFEHQKHLGTDDDVEKRKLNKENYPKSKFEETVSHMKRSVELPPEPLSTHANVYNQGYYDTVDPNRTDIDERGNLRNWLRCYKKPVKSETELLNEKYIATEAKEKTGENAENLISGNYAVGVSESVNTKEKNEKKAALIYVKQPDYKKQAVQESYFNTEIEESTEGFQQTEYLERNKLGTVEVKAKESFGDKIEKEPYQSAQPKQICHLYIRDSDRCHVRPGAYGMPSTSYELLHNIRPEEELPFLPVNEYAVIYHPGISDIKNKKRRKLLIRKEQQKATSNEILTEEEVQTHKEQKETFEAKRSELINANDVKEISVEEEIKRGHMMHQMQEKKYLDQMKLSVIADSEMQKSGQKIKVNGKELADAQNVKSESTHQKMKAILHLREDQSKPINLKKETIPKKAKELKDVGHINRDGISNVEKSVKRSTNTGLFEHSHSEHILDNTPPLLKLSRVNEISFQPLALAVKLESHVKRQSRNYKTFKRAKHRGTVEFIAKGNINPESYKRDCTSYQGPLDFTNYTAELQFAPIHEYSTVYHPGNTYMKSRKVSKRKKAPEFQNEEELSTSKTKMHINYSEANRREKGKDSEAVLSKNEGHETKYVAKIVCKTTPKGRKTKKHLFKYRRVSGDVEIIEKSFVRPETYNLHNVPYDGPVSCLEHEEGLSFTPLQECAKVYHSGISYKKTKESRDSSTESSSSTSLTSSSSTSSISTKKDTLHVPSNRKRDKNGLAADSSKHKGILSFLRKSVSSGKDGNFTDDKENQLEASSESHFLLEQQRPQVSVNFTSSQATSSSQIASTLLPKDSTEKSESESKKMSAKIYIKKEPFITSEHGEDNDRSGKFNLFHFWRSTDKESKLNSKKSDSVFVDMTSSGQEPLNYITDYNSLHEEAHIRSATNIKKSISYEIDKNLSSNVKVSKLTLSEDIKEEPLVHTSLSATSQAIPVAENNAFTYLKRDSELPDDLPLNISGRTETSRQKISAEGIDDSTLEKGDKHDHIRYTAKISVKQEMKSVDDSRHISKLKGKEKTASDDAVSKISGFVVKGFHLRGSPCDLRSEIAAHSTANYEPEKDKQITETGDETIMNETSSTSNASRLTSRKEDTGLKIKKKMAKSGVTLKGKEKDNGKSTGGSFFSSLWRGSKLKGSDQVEHQKQQKLVGKDVHKTDPTSTKVASPADELRYNILGTKAMLVSAESSNLTDIGGQKKQKFVPVYDFSYVPSFPVLAKDMEMTTGKKQIGLNEPGVVSDELIPEAKGRKKSKLRQLFSHRSKNMKRSSDISASLENQDESGVQEQSVDIRKQASKKKALDSESVWKKSDAEVERLKIQRTGQGTFENEQLFHRNGISGGEASDESYKFTQTPPDIPVQVAHQADHKRPSDFVEQVKRQVTQVITKTSPSSDVRKQLTKVKQAKASASPGESKNSSVSEFEIAPHHNFFNQSKKNGGDPEVINELPSDAVKLKDQRMPLKEHEGGMHDLMNVEVISANRLADVEGSHADVELWEGITNRPENVVDNIDYQENISKKVDAKQVTHTIEHHVYQTSNASSENEDSGMNVIEATKNSHLIGDVTNFQAPVVETFDNKLASKPAYDVDEVNESYSDIPGELVSSRTVTQGNRTIEIVTYKTEKNGVTETHVEHRVTIHSCEDIDHDAELDQAILEATNMNPDMTVEKIEVKHESQC